MNITEVAFHMGGTNLNTIEIGDLTLYYSYRTLVAYETPEGKLVISQNVWGVTTGKHLNIIDGDKKKRIPHPEFIELAKSVHIVTNPDIVNVWHVGRDTLQAALERYNEEVDYQLLNYNREDAEEEGWLEDRALIEKSREYLKQLDALFGIPT